MKLLSYKKSHIAGSSSNGSAYGREGTSNRRGEVVYPLTGWYRQSIQKDRSTYWDGSCPRGEHEANMLIGVNTLIGIVA